MHSRANTANSRMIWAYLAHLSFNMWSDRPTTWGDDSVVAYPELRFDNDVWRRLTERMAEVGVNMLVLDIGDGIIWNSHPEISVQDAWSVDCLRHELQRLRGMGIEPVPKLNFSACHDLWLGRYERMVSTDVYYQVCADLIAETISIFEKPRFFHLGMDEEDYANQHDYSFVVMRQYDLWWHDLRLLVEQVEKHGCRAWVWSDKSWHGIDDFAIRMPTSVVQSSWWYHPGFSFKHKPVKAFLDLAEAGYDQIPTGGNCYVQRNLQRLVSFCQRHGLTDNLLGFLQTSWCPTMRGYEDRHIRALDDVGRAKAIWEYRT